MSRNLLAVAVLASVLAISCQQPKKAATSPAKPDPLLGKWVCLADNVNANPKHTMEFRADGTVLMLIDGKTPMTTKYKRQSGKDWLKGRPSSPGSDDKNMPWNQPGVEMISFAGPDGQFMDWGGSLLTLDPTSKTLSNPLTQLWCRPGDEARIRKLSGMDAQEAQAKKDAAERKAWRPSKDITKRWHKAWEVDLPGEERGDYSVVAGDVDGDGAEEAIVSDQTGFLILDSAGKVVRRVKTDKDPNHALALGKGNGQVLAAQFGTWGHALTAFDTKGAQKWKFETSSGIDWVAPVKIDDKNTGFVIGYNGGNAELVDPSGKSVWKADIPSNVWSVASGKLRSGVAESAICVGPDGALAYDVRGKKVGEYGPTDAGAVGAADLNGDGIDEVLTLGTTVSSGLNVTAFDASGKQLWSHKGSDSGSGYVDGNPFVFGVFGKERLLGVASGSAIRFFKPDGSHLGDCLIPGVPQSVASLSRKGRTDALLVRVNNGVRCYELK